MYDKLLKTEKEFIEGLLSSDEKVVYSDLPILHFLSSSSSKKSWPGIIFWNLLGAAFLYYFLAIDRDPMEPSFALLLMVVIFIMNLIIHFWEALKIKLPNRKFRNLIITNQRLILLDENLEAETVLGSDIRCAFEDFANGSWVTKIKFKNSSNIYIIAQNESQKVKTLIEEIFLSKAQLA